MHENESGQIKTLWRTNSIFSISSQWSAVTNSTEFLTIHITCKPMLEAILKYVIQWLQCCIKGNEEHNEKHLVNLAKTQPRIWGPDVCLPTRNPNLTSINPRSKPKRAQWLTHRRWIRRDIHKHQGLWIPSKARLTKHSIKC